METRKPKGRKFLIRDEMNKILLVDDEPEWCGPYLEILAVGFEVIVKHSAQAALDYVETHLDIEGVILDVMMPTPQGVSTSLTNRSLDTGIWMVGELKEYILGHKCPVIVITNREKRLFQERLDTHKIDLNLMVVKMKSEINPNMLAVIMRQMIDSNK